MEILFSTAGSAHMYCARDAQSKQNLGLFTARGAVDSKQANLTQLFKNKLENSKNSSLYKKPLLTARGAHLYRYSHMYEKKEHAVRNFRTTNNKRRNSSQT